MGEGSRDCGTGTIVSRTPYRLRTIGQPRRLATTALKYGQESMKDSRFHLSEKNCGGEGLDFDLKFRLQNIDVKITDNRFHVR